jgi:phenylpropionate dioxygenase-like ring-hydroxylating dioxygenase large terminal subunit
MACMASPRPASLRTALHRLGRPAPRGLVLDNLHPALEHAWHPVALAGELAEGGYVQARLLGRNWTVHRRDGELDADPPAWGVTERHGVIWVAPAEPRDDLLDVPEAADEEFAAAWLHPARSSAPAGRLADGFLDGAQSASVHAATAGAADGQEVRLDDVTVVPGGLTSVQEQWIDDAGVGRGERRRRRATYLYRAPFQLLLRLEEIDTGAVRTILFLLQPEDADSTRVYTCLFLRGIGGAVIRADVVAAEVAFEEAVLAEHLPAGRAPAGRSAAPPQRATA